MKRVCKLSSTEDIARYDGCNSTFPPITRTSLLGVAILLTLTFFLDWVFWGGTLIGNGKFYLDDLFASLPHLRIHHYHDGFFLLIVTGIGWLFWRRLRSDWCCSNRSTLITLFSTGFYFCILAGIFLIVRDFSDVLLWWETGNFFPDPP